MLAARIGQLTAWGLTPHKIRGLAGRSPNDPSGVAMRVDRVQALHPTLIVREATEGLERAVTSALAAAGLPVAGHRATCSPSPALPRTSSSWKI